jgi:hypothetical protein
MRTYEKTQNRYSQAYDEGSIPFTRSKNPDAGGIVIFGANERQRGDDTRAPEQIATGCREPPRLRSLKSRGEAPFSVTLSGPSPVAVIDEAKEPWPRSRESRVPQSSACRTAKSPLPTLTA